MTLTLNVMYCSCAIVSFRDVTSIELSDIVCALLVADNGNTEYK